MAENKKGFVLYADQKTSFDDLTDTEAGILIKHIFSYVNDENPVLEDRILQIAFNPIKLQLKRDLKKYESIKEKRSFAGQKSAEMRQQTSTHSTHVDFVKHTSTHSTVIDKDNVNVNDTVKDNVTVNVNDTVKDNVTVNVNDTVIKNIEQRKINFSLSLNPFLEKYIPEFGLNGAKDMLNKFYLYWSEANPNGKKMKWEMQKTWDLKGRLRTWADNQVKFNKTNNNGTKQASAGSRKTDIIALNKLSTNVLQQFELNENFRGSPE
jgi:hypothetical protein